MLLRDFTDLMVQKSNSKKIHAYNMREAPKKGCNSLFLDITPCNFHSIDFVAKLIIFPNNIGIELCGEENLKGFGHLIMILEGFEV